MIRADWVARVLLAAIPPRAVANGGYAGECTITGGSAAGGSTALCGTVLKNWHVHAIVQMVV